MIHAFPTAKVQTAGGTNEGEKERYLTRRMSHLKKPATPRKECSYQLQQHMT
jgi:hypothetical protein